jgi:deoxyribodipyrimidine photo-lyase
LAAHAGDERPFQYTKAQLEQARTHDPYWNAAMREMRYTGYMHNAMRMYWGKKILEWGKTPEEAYRTALTLNNTYFLDGRDANSFANIGWVFGLHDRPWGGRAIYGTVRSMSSKGLERKADMEAYIAKVDALVEEAKAAGVRFEGD